MKKYLILLAALPVAFASCVGDDDDLFDRSPAVRIEDAMTRYDDLLRGAPNGWIVEYFPEAGQRYGGFNLYFKFGDDGRVTVGSELSDDLVESLYSIKGDMGPTLNFDTHNEVLHYFSDPAMDAGGGQGYGYEGDYEFVLMSGDASQIVMSGKKTRNTIRLVPLAAGTTWDEYVAPIRAIRDVMISAIRIYTLKVDGQQVETLYSNRFFTFGSGETEVEAPFMFTQTGIRFYEPVEVNGVTMRDFTFDPATLSFTSADGKAVISTEYVPLNRAFAQTGTQWFFVLNSNYMSNNFFSLLVDAYRGILAQWPEGDLYDVYLGWSHNETAYSGTALSFVYYEDASTYNWAGYKFVLSEVTGTDDQVNVTYSTDADKYFLNGENMKDLFEPFVDEISANSPYVVTVLDDPENPGFLLFESAADPDIYFVLAL